MYLPAHDVSRKQEYQKNWVSFVACQSLFTQERAQHCSDSHNSGWLISLIAL